jgi:phosphoglycerol transferase MdoB-like AlkP superfamily enzyme
MVDVTSPNIQTEKWLHKRIGAVLRFLAGLPLIFLCLLLLTIALKLVFLTKNWSALEPAGWASIARALWKGLRFDASILSCILIPGTLLYFAAFITQWRFLRWILQGYFALVALLMPLLWLADLQYFEETGKHFTSELLDYLGPSVWPDISGAFKLHPWLSSLSLLVCAALLVLTVLGIRRLSRVCFSTGEMRRAYFLLALPVFLLLEGLAVHGTFHHQALRIGDSCISSNPHINALCLNPVFSSFKASTSSTGRQFRFYDEEFNIATTRNLLGCGKVPPLNPRYPLLRESSGFERGNRKNIVVFVLESWSGQDMGCLGSKAGVTPVFDDLARGGLLFTRFYATGIRTAEGMLSILCSFPNQPSRAIMGRPGVYQTHWRSISQILDEIGYRNLFISGRSLKFDNMKEFLGFIRFHTIIGKDDFPASVTASKDSWAGYSDEDVMRRADEEFARSKDRPFLGVIYTMNSHSPFEIPPGVPTAYPPSSVTNKYLNSIKYTDATLGSFFRLARSRPYFKDTIFLFVADHARTREKFGLADQHYIPLLIYAPGQISPGTDSQVAGQVDLLPTILGLLQLKTIHASWGRDLLTAPKDEGFAFCVVGGEVRWRQDKYLLSDHLSRRSPLLFDTIRDPKCTENLWQKRKKDGETLQTRLRAYLSLSQTLLRKNRVYPWGSERPMPS